MQGDTSSTVRINAIVDDGSNDVIFLGENVIYNPNGRNHPNLSYDNGDNFFPIIIILIWELIIHRI